MTLNPADFTLHDVSRFPLVLAMRAAATLPQACADGSALVGGA